MTKNILLIGVGGQGTITASKVLTLGLVEAGYDVKMSEIHGMSQRGGSVVSQVRYGDKIESPVIEPGTADIVVAFEKMEALRGLEYLREGGLIVVNDQEIESVPIQMGKFDYPADVIEILESKARTIVVEAEKLAGELGNKRVTNMILLGTIIKGMELENIAWEKILKENTKAGFLDINLRAINAGKEQLA